MRIFNFSITWPESVMKMRRQMAEIIMSLKSMVGSSPVIPSSITSKG
jgi:hypothetical protein